MKTSQTSERRVTALLELLGELADGQRDLLAAIEEKIAAMRRGSPEAIRDATLREQEIVTRMTDRENLRRQLTVNIARGYGVGADAARRLSAAQLADRIGGTDGARIRSAAQAMKEQAVEIARRNHVAQLIAQNVLRHVKLAFAAMTEGRRHFGYSASGNACVAGCERILDAVG